MDWKVIGVSTADPKVMAIYVLYYYSTTAY